MKDDTTLLSRGLYQGLWASRVKPPNDRLGSARQMSGSTSGGTTRNPPRDLLVWQTAIAWPGNASEFITLEYGLSPKWVGIPYQPLEPKEGKFGGW
jgi:hypothetical protein